MGLDSYLYRSLTADELEAAKQALAPFENALTTTGEQTTEAGVAIPQYINPTPQVYPERAIIAHWRSSYRLHQWFIDNGQDGVDHEDGRLVPVGRDDLLGLLQLLKAVDAGNADDLLPSAIGEGEYEQEEVDDARELVEYLLAHFRWDECRLFYSACW